MKECCEVTINGAGRNSSFFSGDNLARLCQSMKPHHYNAGSALYLEGDEAGNLYYIFAGIVKTTKSTEEGREQMMAFFHTGDFFGQLDALPKSRHRFNARALEPCEIGTITRLELEALMLQHNDLALEMANWMGYMNLLTQTKLRDLLAYGKSGALCSTLIRLSNDYGKRTEDGILITLRLTNNDIADIIGSARESVNRMLADLKKADAVKVQDGYITITNLAYIQDICKCELCPVELCRM